ncbi:YrvL family regulatory protein [Bacillus carboniphilus]|uniref:YrvL family regulatory protein n=1 Tax=Bacillus carboniphilus TaxID=86663 RepID=UPI003CD05C46
MSISRSIALGRGENWVSDNSSFRDIKLFTKVIVITAIIFLVIFSVSLVLGIFYFGFAGIFSLLGVKYDSFYSLLIFVLSYFLAGFVTDIFSDVFVRLSTHFISGKLKLFFTRMIIYCTFSLLLLFTIDEFMSSITIPFSIKILIALFLFTIEIAFDDKNTKRNKT